MKYEYFSVCAAGFHSNGMAAVGGMSDNCIECPDNTWSEPGAMDESQCNSKWDVYIL